MNNIPTGTRVKMPALTKLNSTAGNGLVKYTNIETVKKINYTDKAPSATTATTTTTMKTTFSVTKPLITAGKISVDGKVVGIDVLTKLQQQNVGNIVSFTASKEFLSNLTNSKFSLGKTVLTTKKPDQSVFRVTKSNPFLQPVVKKIAPEKLLLPKTQLNGIKQTSNVEVKKFAPEMKGLLTGLSTALKTTTTTPASSQSVQLIKSTNFLPITNVTGGNLGKGNVLIALKTSKPLTYISTSSTRSLPAVSTFKASLPARVIRPVIQHNQPKQSPQARYTQPHAKGINRSLAQQTQAITTTMGNKQANVKNVVTHNKQVVTNTPSKNNNYLEKASSISASIDSGRINLFRKNNKMISDQEIELSKYKSIISTSAEAKNKTISTSVVTTLLNMKKCSNDQHPVNKVSDQKQFNVTTSAQLYKHINSPYSRNEDQRKAKKLQDEVTQRQPGRRENNKSIAGFTELYEKAVQNVLNIKAFPDDLINEKENSSNFKDFEKEYQKYLETPMELDQKIKRNLSLIYGDKSKNNIEEPSEKKQKLENISPSYLYNTPDKIHASTYGDKISVADFFDFKPNANREHTRLKSIRKEIDTENRRFFSQFLSEQAFTRHDNSGSYYSPSDFPWVHQSYLYDRYYPQPMPYYYYGERHDGDGKRDEIHDNETEKLSHSTEHSRMKLLNAVKKPKDVKKEQSDEEMKLKISPDEEVKKINKNKKVTGKTKSGSNRSTPSQEKEKKAKAKESLKIKRYTLRQRALALKKAKKLAIAMPPEPPKFILKELTGRSVTKKELFLGTLGLRRILKRIDRKVKVEK